MNKRYLYNNNTVLSFEYYFEQGYFVVWDGNKVADKIAETTYFITTWVDDMKKEGLLVEIDPLKPLQTVNNEIVFKIDKKDE